MADATKIMTANSYTLGFVGNSISSEINRITPKAAKETVFFSILMPVGAP
jgi:hypothetical protein